MPSFFDRFRDLDQLKDRLESAVDSGVRETKRQAALAKLRVRIFDLERRMNAEFRELGERVWELHNAEALTVENLAGAFDALESLADEAAAAKDEMEELATRPDLDEPVEESDAAEEPPPPPSPPAPAGNDGDPPDRLLDRS